MANTRLIKRRVKSAKNISQITRAMQMVAASKMKKAQGEALRSKPYSQKVLEIVQALAEKTDPRFHSLLKKPKKTKKILIVLMTTNKGLCGSLNTNLFRTLEKFMTSQKPQGASFEFVTLGKKGQTFVVKSGGTYIADFSDTLPVIESVGSITKILTEGFLKRKYAQVLLVYNDFVNALVQKPFFRRILPITAEEVFREKRQEEKVLKEAEYLLEPSAGKILNFLLPFYLEIQVREAILESQASEHSARMMAMKNATDNAADLMASLTLEYNKARQTQITAEIADITTAKESLEGK